MNFYGYVGYVTIFSSTFTNACCLVVGLGLGLQWYSVWLVSCLAHAFVILSIVIATLPLCLRSSLANKRTHSRSWASFTLQNKKNCNVRTKQYRIKLGDIFERRVIQKDREFVRGFCCPVTANRSQWAAMQGWATTADAAQQSQGGRTSSWHGASHLRAPVNCADHPHRHARVELRARHHIARLQACLLHADEPSAAIPEAGSSANFVLPTRRQCGQTQGRILTKKVDVAGGDGFTMELGSTY